MCEYRSHQFCCVGSWKFTRFTSEYNPTASWSYEYMYRDADIGNNCPLYDNYYASNTPGHFGFNCANYRLPKPFNTYGNIGSSHLISIGLAFVSMPLHRFRNAAGSIVDLFSAPISNHQGADQQQPSAAPCPLLL